MSAAPASPDPLSRSRERVGVRARALRSISTDAERLLWQYLRDRRMNGCKFRRQHPVGFFIADFASIEAGLVIEIDGGQHFESKAQHADERRSALLHEAGFEVLRFDNRQVLLETASVLDAIRQRLLEKFDPHPSPLPPAGEGV